MTPLCYCFEPVVFSTPPQPFLCASAAQDPAHRVIALMTRVLVEAVTRQAGHRANAVHGLVYRVGSSIVNW